MGKKDKRQDWILREVHLHNRVQLQDLAVQLGVSVDTVRRDIKEMYTRGDLKQVHGGAVSNSFGFEGKESHKEVYALQNKRLIAQKAVRLIKEGQIILISGGTTNLELVRQLPPKLEATFFTPSLTIALELLLHPNLEVIFIGGKLSKAAQVAVGGAALHALSSIKTDWCFLGTGYLDAAEGLTEFDWEVVQMKKAMVKAAHRLVSLTISEKLNSVQRYRICRTSDIHTLITECDPEDPLLAPYRQHTQQVM